MSHYLRLAMLMWDDESCGGGGLLQTSTPRSWERLSEYVGTDLWVYDWGQPPRPATRRQAEQVSQLVSSLAATALELSL